MRKPLLIPFTLFLVVLFGLPAVAASIDLTIPITTRAHGPAGSEQVLASVDVPEDLQGQVCQVSAVSTNQSSVHPDNDLRVDSNGSSVLLEGVEDVAGGTVTADGTLTLGEQVTVTLIFGPDRTFSAGITVLVDCEATTTTTQATTTTTEASTTTTIGTTSTTVGVTSTSLDTTTTSDNTTGCEGGDLNPACTLPFTGPDGAAPVAVGMVAAGLLVLLAAKVVKE